MKSRLIIFIAVLGITSCAPQQVSFITESSFWLYMHRTYFGGNNLLQWGAFSLIIIASFIVSKLFLSTLKLRYKHQTDETKNRVSVTQLIVQTLRKYIYSIMFLIFIRLGIITLNVSREIEKVVHTSLVIAIIWLLTIFTSRLYGNFMLGWQAKIAERDDTEIAHLFPLFIRAGRLLIYVFGFLFILNRAGYNLYSAIAGLSVGGFALAMAGREAVGHIFAGISLYLDKVVKEGDYLLLDSPADTWGVVEKVGIRSTTIRTKYNTMLIVPNSLMANNAVQNISAAGNKRMFRTKIYISTDTNPREIEQAITFIKNFLSETEYVEDAELHFTKFGIYGLGLRLQYFVRPYIHYHDVVNYINLKIMYYFSHNGIKLARGIDAVNDKQK